MKAIKITQEIKDKNAKYGTLLSKKEVGTIHANLPNQFFNTEPVSGGYQNRTDLHDADGWKDVIVPTFDPATQKLGNELIEDGNTYTYQVIDKTEEELKNEVSNNNESNKQALLQSLMEGKIIDEAQAMPDEEALGVQSLYPLWDDFGEEHLFEAGFKVNSFDGLELKLFRAINPNNKRANTEPILTPALWSKIEFSGGVEIWSQPIGGDGKYPYLDPDTGLPYVVEHNGFLWTNDVPAPTLNVWEPSIYGWLKGDAV